MSARTSVFALAAASALAAFTAAPARAAGLPVSARSFSLNFPEGWQAFPVGGNDSLKIVMQPDLEATCYLSSHLSDHPVTAQELEAYRKAYAQGQDSVTQVAEGTATLGGKAFTYVEYQDADTTGGVTRVRFYYTSSGNLLFTAFVGYAVPKGNGAVTQVESALATLTLNAGVPVRPVAALALAARRPVDRDALGRSRAFAPRAALFRLPAF